MSNWLKCLPLGSVTDLCVLRLWERALNLSKICSCLKVIRRGLKKKKKGFKLLAAKRWVIRMLILYCLATKPCGGCLCTTPGAKPERSIKVYWTANLQVALEETLCKRSSWSVRRRRGLRRFLQWASFNGIIAQSNSQHLTKHSVCAWHCSRCFTSTSSFNSHFNTTRYPMLLSPFYKWRNGPCP